MFCRNCGEAAKDEDVFCRACGAALYPEDELEQSAVTPENLSPETTTPETGIPTPSDETPADHFAAPGGLYRRPNAAMSPL